MNLVDAAAVAVGIVTVLGGVAAFLQFLVKHYLNELKPNSGSSLRDSVDRLERQVEEIYRILLSRSNS
jgi:hypothetical protein